ncbi:MAG TPA: hypothetical protein VK935_01030 [Actinomycetospora sp.]|nr:hypothetical protein [Actinomycetospora sp.]
MKAWRPDAWKSDPVLRALDAYRQLEQAALTGPAVVVPPTLGPRS